MMGIQGLLRFVKDASDEIHIKKYAGKVVAVDTYCWIHRGCFACADKLARKERTDTYVKYCMKFVTMLESYNVKPILVFDGCRLPSKAMVEQQRHQRRRDNLEKGRQFLREGNLSAARDCFTKCVSVTSEMALEVMRAARNRGVDCIVAPYEADAQLAFFSKYDHVDAIVTEDSDLLCFGCKRVIFKMDLTGRAQEVTLENLGRVKNLVGFTPDSFRHMCILSGCDYLPNVKGVGLAKACKALKASKSKDAYQVARKLHQFVKNLPPVDAEYAAGFERADKTFLYQLVFDPYQRRLIPLNAYPSDVTADDVKYAGEVTPNDVALQLAVGNINVATKQVVSNFDVDSWAQSRKSFSKLPSVWGKKSVPRQRLPEKSSGIFQASIKNLHEDQIVTPDAAAKPQLHTMVAATNKNTGLVVASAKPKDLQNGESPAAAVSYDQSLAELIQMYKAPTKPEQITKSRFFRPSRSVQKQIPSCPELRPHQDKAPEKPVDQKVTDKDKHDTNDELLDEILDELDEQNCVGPRLKRSNPFAKEASSPKHPCIDKSPRHNDESKHSKTFSPLKISLSVTAVDKTALSEHESDEHEAYNDGRDAYHDKNCGTSTDVTSNKLDDVIDHNADDVISSEKNSQTESLRKPLSTILEPNGQDKKEQSFVISSDEECSIKVKTVNKTLGIGKKKLPPKKSVVSKYFGAAKASGLRKSVKPQRAITSFFSKLS